MQSNNCISSKDKLFDNQIWLTNTEAADYLRISPNALNVLRSKNKGIVPTYHIGNRLRFKRSDLDLLLESSLNKRSNHGY
jgi:predicted DNA-binding protein (MmcQ/YjbR family)